MKYLPLALLALPLLAQAAPIATAPVEYCNVEATWSSLGVAEAERQSTVSAQTSGRIVAINFRAGDRVQQGQVIMRIDPATANQDVAGMQARLNEAQVQMDNARKQYERVRDLLAQKYVSQAQVDKAEADYKSAQAQVNTLKANLGQSTTARSFTNVVAPYSGVMSALHVELGEMASPGSPLATGYDPSQLRVTAQIPQTQIDAVRRGAKAYVEIPGLPNWQAARSVIVLPSADPRSHTTEVRVMLPADTANLIPGQFARAHFVTGTARRLVVPAAAVLRRSELTAVYVVPSGKAPQLRQIRAGQSLPGGLVEVLAGVKEGEQVALDPVAATLKP